VLTGRDPGPHQDALVLGTALLLEVTGRVRKPDEARTMAEACISDGRAAALLKQLRAFSEALR